MNSTASNEEEKKDRISILEIIGILTSIIGSIGFFISIIPGFEFLYFLFIAHPFLIGLISSWFFATITVFIVLFSVNHVKKTKKDDYNEVFRQSEKWLRRITLVVLFYIAIHLASKALWTIGIPILGEPYYTLLDEFYHSLLNESLVIPDSFQYISPHDVFLCSLAICIILLIGLAPYISRDTIVKWLRFSPSYVRVSKVTLVFISSILISVIAVLVVCISPLLITFEPSPYWFNLDDVPENDSDGLLRYLVDYHGIGWAESAEIRKSNDSRTINISKDKNLAVIMIKDKYLFSWDDVPGNDNWRLIDFLKQNYGIDWVETEKIRKIDENNTINVSTEKNSLDLKLNDEKTNVSLEIDGSRIGEFTAKMENGNIYVTKMENAILKISNQSYDLKLEKKDDKFRLSPSTNVRFSEHDLHFLAIIFLLSSILFIWLLIKTKKQRKQIKAEFRDLFIFFCCTPAIVVAALAVAGNDLLRFPNVAGPIVVGVLLISGFYTLVTIATMSFSSEDNLYHVFVCLALASLAAISGLTVLFSLSVPQEVLEEFGKLLNFAVAIILVVLLYGFFYEKMEKYRFTEWWRREWRPIAIAMCYG